MVRTFLMAAVVAGVSFGITTDAKAVFFTSNGTVQVEGDGNSGGFPIGIAGGGNLTFNLSGSEGAAFTNQVSGTSGFSPGSEIRTVSAIVIGRAGDGAQENIALPDGTSDGNLNGPSLVAVSGLRGIVKSGAPDAVADFFEGRAFVYAAPSGFDANDPSTWGFSSASLIASYVLADRQAALSGFIRGEGSFFGETLISASNMNLSAVNNDADPDVTDGTFLFIEDSAGADITTTATGGDNFIRDVENVTDPNVNPFAPGPGLAIQDEGLLARIKQELELASISLLDLQLDNADDGELNGSAGFDASELSELEAIAEASFAIDAADPGSPFSTDADLTGSGDYFATSIGGEDDIFAFNPNFSTSDADDGNGDFKARLSQTSFDIGHTVVPEPTSLALFGIGLSLMAVYGRRRQQREV